MAPKRRYPFSSKTRAYKRRRVTRRKRRVVRRPRMYRKRIFKRKGSLKRANNFETEVIKLAPYTVAVTSPLTGGGDQTAIEISASRAALALGTRNFASYWQFKIKKYMVRVTAERTVFGQTDWTISHPKNVIFFQDPLNQILEASAAGINQNVEMLPMAKKCHFMGGTKKGVPVLPYTETVTSSGAISTSQLEVVKRAQYHPCAVGDGLNYYLTSCYLPAWKNDSFDFPEMGAPDAQQDNVALQKYRVEIWCIVNFKGKRPIGT